MKQLVIAAFLAVLAQPAAAQQAPASSVQVTLAPAITGPSSGRLLVFAQKVEPGAAPSESIDTSPFEPTGTAIAGREVAKLSAGQVATIDTATDVFPAPFAKLPAGTYRFQAVLDRNRDYNYRGRGGGDIVSSVIEARLPGAVPMLTLDAVLPEATFESGLAKAPPAIAAMLRANAAKLKPVDFVSPSLSAFWGRPVPIRGWIALPPGYGEKGRTFPTAYVTGGFGSTLISAQANAAGMLDRMASGAAPPMIWVVLDQSSPTGTHEFADSVNNGPWGKALTEELIPALEKRYAMDARPGSRFLNGHSSGGWAALWLLVRYPKIFGGSWPTAPDPADFREFTNADLYAANANAYVQADGGPTPLIRQKGQRIATFEQFAKLEAAMGVYGGQLASFEWVFSPKGPDGRPMPVFDRATGRIDPQVAAYWRDHYDVAHIVQRDWTRLKPDLDGKLHLIVGTADTFYLDEPARLLDQALTRLGAKHDFRYIEGRDHFDLYARDGDNRALMMDIAWEMYAVARPGIKRPTPKPDAP